MHNSRESILRSLLDHIAEFQRSTASVSLTPGQFVEMQHASVSRDQNESTVYFSNTDMRTILIGGGRGFGKTTLLNQLAEHLTNERRADRLVFPPIRPDLFISGDHPLGWVLSSFALHVNALLSSLSREGLSERTEDLKVRRAIFEDSAAAFLTAPRLTQQHSDSSVESNYPVEQYRSGANVTDSYYKLVDLMFACRRELAEKRQEQFGTPLLVILIDDLDLFPSNGELLLNMLPTLLIHPSVAIVMTADYNLLFSKLMVENTKMFGAQGRPEVVAALTRDQLKKRLPLQYRETITSYSDREALLFKPLHAKRSLLEMMRKVLVRRSDFGPCTLADYFDLRWAFKEEEIESEDLLYSMYARMLPDEPRSLVQLYDVMRADIEKLAAALQAHPETPLDEIPDYQDLLRNLIVDFCEHIGTKHPDATEHVVSKLHVARDQKSLTIDDFQIRTSTSFYQRRFSNGRDCINILSEVRARTEKGESDLSEAASVLVHFFSDIAWFPFAKSSIGRIHPSREPVYVLNQRDDKSLDVEWPPLDFDTFITHEVQRVYWTTWADSLFKKGVRRTQEDDPVTARVLVFVEYMRSICKATVGRSICLKPLSGITRTSLPEIASDLLKLMKQTLEVLTKNRGSHDSYASSLRGDLTLYWVTALQVIARLPELKEELEDVPGVDEVATLAQLVYEGILPTLEIQPERLEYYSQRASARLRAMSRNYSAFTISPEFITHIWPRLLAHDNDAIRQANTALEMDPSPSQERDQLQTILERLKFRPSSNPAELR